MCEVLRKQAPACDVAARQGAAR